jgi:hypothetical protein
VGVGGAESGCRGCRVVGWRGWQDVLSEEEKTVP